MKIYAKMQDESTARVAHLLKLFHGPLFEAGLKIDLLSVTNEDGEACLTHQGYPAAAVVRIVDSKGRTMGRGDAEIVIDEATYMGFTDPEKDALLDHELYHIELKTKTDPKTDQEFLVRDENGRPKLKLRKHDVQAGWFSEIAERHGAASMERKQALQIYLGGQQTFFAFDAGEQVKMIEAQGDAGREATREFTKTVADAGATLTITHAGKSVVLDSTARANLDKLLAAEKAAETSGDFLKRAAKFERKGKP